METCLAFSSIFQCYWFEAEDCELFETLCYEIQRNRNDVLFNGRWILSQWLVLHFIIYLLFRRLMIILRRCSPCLFHILAFASSFPLHVHFYSSVSSIILFRGACLVIRNFYTQFIACLSKRFYFLTNADLEGLLQPGKRYH